MIPLIFTKSFRIDVRSYLEDEAFECEYQHWERWAEKQSSARFSGYDNADPIPPPKRRSWRTLRLKKYIPLSGPDVEIF